MHHSAFATRDRVRAPSINSRPRPLNQFSRTSDNKQGDRGFLISRNVAEKGWEGEEEEGRGGRANDGEKVSPAKSYSIMRSRMHAEIARHGILHAYALRLHRRSSALINIITRREAGRLFYDLRL